MKNKNYELIDNYIEKLMKESTPDKPIWNIENIRQGKKAHWNYIDGCMMTSLLSLYNETKHQEYFDFVDNYIDYYIFDDGEILGYQIEHFRLDDINESRVLFDLYEKTKKEKYLKAIAKTYGQILTQPRTYEGNFWHKDIYPNQVWLDGLYMAMPFYALYETKMNDCKNIQDIINQYKLVRKHLFDEEKQLYYHGYDASKSVFWADKETGLSKNFWLRAIGWFTVSLVDVAEIIKEKCPNEYVYVASLLKEIIDSILKYQDKDSKMFYQVVDHKEVEGNYLETSGSAMISYAILKATRLGILNENYRTIGNEIFDGICNKYLTEVNGDLNLEGICLVAGLGPEKDKRRDGTIAYYLSEPIVKNDAKGVGPLIMAYTEVRKTL